MPWRTGAAAVDDAGIDRRGVRAAARPKAVCGGGWRADDVDNHGRTVKRQRPRRMAAAREDSAPKARRMPKSVFSQRTKLFMDVEHINSIGNRLADLTQRTQALRGYL